MTALASPVTSVSPVEFELLVIVLPPVVTIELTVVVVLELFVWVMVVEQLLVTFTLLFEPAPLPEIFVLVFPPQELLLEGVGVAVGLGVLVGVGVGDLVGVGVMVIVVVGVMPTAEKTLSLEVAVVRNCA